MQMRNDSKTSESFRSRVAIVNRYLSASNVMAGVNVVDKPDALKYISLLVERRHGIRHDVVFGFLWRREQIGSTALGSGVAIPHARIAGINEPIVLVLRLLSPIDFSAPDDKLVQLLFVILVPDKAAEEHLQILSVASEMFSDQAFRQRLNTAPDAVELHRLFSGWPNVSR
jgi:PTS system nitrogen regulatory IIA component